MPVARILQYLDGTNSTATGQLGAPLAILIRIYLSMRTFTLLAVFVSLCAGGAMAEPGLPTRYEAKTARKLKPEETKAFGPQAQKYRYDSRMIRAAEIAAARARNRSTNYCWRYVKKALVAADAVDSYPDTRYAKNAATELPREYGFKKIPVRNPYAAPVGAVLVYGGRDAGHVEIRTRSGFVSDYFSSKPRANRPFLGAFILPRAG
jgi:hypothetical protein